MSAERILEEHAETQGWNTETMLLLCLRYIENQGDNSAFDDFLTENED